MSKPRPPRDRDRALDANATASRSHAGDGNALWRYERHRRRNLAATPGPHGVALVLDRLKADFNVPKIFRSAEAFGAHAVHLVDVGPFDPAPAKGGFKHVPAKLHEDFASCRAALDAEGFILVGLDPFADTLIHEAKLPERCAFVLGHELHGLSAEARAASGAQFVRIPQWGQVDSLNVSVAASVALYEYVRQHGSQVPAPVRNEGAHHY
ncbi:RNA methyltransferase [Oleiagrimonas sp. C23AA]|uniref:RNA methyltransferase n=1 Tax=Oleiagrimonas sp. C23AA TaxID=2719047 RepID=UPI001423C940|nr:RNA methyltransferase [Oleiagrimonas sp. C23AA]NII11930.1 RNA methyltransferase [Oleiagrimonas sp. C23AA]